jgi:hypothetical protein
MPLLAFALLLLDCAEHTGRVEWVRSSFDDDACVFDFYYCFLETAQHNLVYAPALAMIEWHGVIS